MESSLLTEKKPVRFAKIVAPILVTQIALYMVTFFDILMTGRYDTYHLAGVTVGSSFWVPVYTGLAGILMSLTPIVAQHAGARKEENVRPAVQQGLYVSIALAAVVFALIVLAFFPVIRSMSLESPVGEIAIRYLKGMTVGLLPLFAYTVLRSFYDGLGSTRVSMFIILISAPINVLLNYLLIYGNFGFPELGGAGAGYASGLTYWIVFAIALGIAAGGKPFRRFRLLTEWQPPRFLYWKEILVIGVPIGLSIFVETSIFSVVTLLMSAYSTTVISAHQVALNFTSLLYMVPLSISMGATILVGQSVGAGRLADAKRYSYMGIGFAVSFSLISIAILLIARESIASLYTADPAIMALAAQFFLYGAFFQLSDAVQAPIQGALRGYKDVNVTLLMGFVSLWVIGLPVGYAVSSYTALGPYGYWVGLITGLTAGAIVLSFRLRYIQRKQEIQTT
ncbi:putative multidrug resistance protein NorM [Sporosarcina sp. NCCP-2716]|uniref:MATE family efflux transporter n=1 Tax=Sporosarcina sp. NCCP-2716 TaxID=2943679 RepID=UPI00203FA8FE|nr:MATE family efflux transporter [Sporosarcina sp. NCCP-2716]GKV68718.1 putative multidrug resistance protein NorM [Sporosarcina sp. NCCP-2716]